MRVGLDYRYAAASPNSGIGRQALAMERALLGLPQVELQRYAVAPAGDPLRDSVNCPAWTCPRAAMHRPHLRLRFEMSYLPRVLRTHEADVYIANFNMGLPLPPRPPGIRYALLLHDLFQITLNNYHASRLKASIYRASDRLSIHYAVNAADQIWTPSDYTARETARLFPRHASKLRVLPNLVEPFHGEVLSAAALDLPDRYWLAVGTRELRKNMPWFVDAWQQARMCVPAVPELVLVGSVEHLPEAQRQLPGLQARGDLNDAQLHTLYRHAERLWQPSYAEGFGLPVVEALSVGTPVAVATGSSLDEVAPPDAPRFSPVDSKGLVELMGRLASPPTIDADALRQWAEEFGMNRYRGRLAKLLEELHQ